MAKPRCLGICLFYNDDDIVEDAITHLLENNHEVVVWDHGSTDHTSRMIDKFNPFIRERHFVPRSFDFYQIFEHVSRHVINHYVQDYDWISFPESDEILEGPDRTKSYFEHVCDVVESSHDWLQFDNMLFWFTSEDDKAESSPRKRIRHYSIWQDCPPRIYAWRASSMNVRWFNHNPPLGNKYPINFKTCHYQWRSEAQLVKRIQGRIGLRRRGWNHHFDFMRINKDRLYIPAARLHFDDGVSELSCRQTINWHDVYGSYDALIEQMKAEDVGQGTEDTALTPPPGWVNEGLKQ
jgi:Glycosyl transferase family 2